MEWVVTYASGSLFLETNQGLHMLQLSRSIWETSVFEVGLQRWRKSTKSPAENSYNTYITTIIITFML